MLHIPGCSGYLASGNGQIFLNGRLRSQRRGTNGVMQVEIGKSTRKVHDLVARAFYGHPLSKGYRVRHANGNRADNRPENLYWASSAAVVPPPPPPEKVQLEREYDKTRLERLVLIDLMQS